MNEAVAALNKAGDACPASLEAASQVLAVAEAMDEQYLLRRSLSEPNATADQISHLVDTLLGPTLSADVVEVVRAGAHQSWPSADALALAIRDQAVRLAWRNAVDKGRVEQARLQVLDLIDLITQDSALSTAIGDTSRSMADRTILVDALAKQAEPVVALLCRSAVSDERGSFTANLSSALDSLASLRGHQRARITTAIAMTQKQASAMQTQLSRIYARPVDLETLVDPRVIGGVRADIGGDIIDGSVRARLDTAREQLQDVRIEALAASEENEHA